MRFERDEAAALKLVAGRAPFRQLRELVRVVQSDACIELDTNRYSVPWRLIGATVTVLAGGDGIVVSHAGAEVARHDAAARVRSLRAVRCFAEDTAAIHLRSHHEQTDFAALRADARQIGADTLVRLGEDAIVIEDMAMTDLSAAMFLF